MPTWSVTLPTRCFVLRCLHRGRDREPPGSDPCHLYVGYLAPHVTESMLEGLFRSCGEVGGQQAARCSPQLSFFAGSWGATLRTPALLCDV